MRIDTAAAAARWSVTQRTVQLWCRNGRIPGAVLTEQGWMLPEDAERPADARTAAGRRTHRCIDRCYLIAGPISEEYPSQANSYDRTLSELYHTLLTGRLSEADLGLERFLRECPDRDYHVPALLLRLYISFYPDRPIAELHRQLDALRGTKCYPLIGAILDVYTGRSYDIASTPDIPDELLYWFLYHEHRRMLTDAVRTQRWPDMRPYELCCRLLDTTRYEMLQAYYHTLLAAVYALHGEHSRHDRHRDRARGIVLKHGWILIAAQSALTVSWPKDCFPDEESYTRFKHFTHAMIEQYMQLLFPAFPMPPAEMDMILMMQIAFQATCRKSNEEIAANLGLSLYMVKKHLSELYALTNTEDREHFIDLMISNVTFL